MARVALAGHLTQMREEAGLKRPPVARACDMSLSTLWRMETAQTAADVLKVRALCAHYHAAPERTEELVRLARETTRLGWWQDLAIPEGLATYIAMEDAAVRLETYQPELVPGLMQTEDYARVLSGLSPGISADEAERLVRVRATRQGLVTRALRPLQVDAVLSEAVLARPVGGGHVMAAQLFRMAEMAGQPSVSIRVVPLSASISAGTLAGSFTILQFPTAGGGLAGQPPTVFIDELAGTLCLTDSENADRYGHAFNAFSDVCLEPAESRELILKYAKEMEEA
jgi:uncharacterized protein DUF5753/helix-turn-helix protein